MRDEIERIAMTMGPRSRTRGEGRGDSRAAFVKQAAAEETQQLHCMIPESLHIRFRVMAAQERTTVTALVIDAMTKYMDERSS